MEKECLRGSLGIASIQAELTVSQMECPNSDTRSADRETSRLASFFAAGEFGWFGCLQSEEI